MTEIAELTIAVPGSMERAGAPHFPWPPDVIENMEEEERKGYLEIIREQRKIHARKK